MPWFATGMRCLPLALAAAPALFAQDADGDLAGWMETQWQQNRCRHALVSTSSRDIGDLARTPWVIGILFKPYPLDQVIRALEP